MFSHLKSGSSEVQLILPKEFKEDSMEEATFVQVLGGEDQETEKQDKEDQGGEICQDFMGMKKGSVQERTQQLKHDILDPKKGDTKNSSW